MLNRISLIIASLILLQAAKGQKLLELKSYDTTAYVYRLDKAQLDFLAERNNLPDTAFLFTHLFKKYSRNSNYMPLRPYGSFIIATVDQARINYQYVHTSSFEIRHKVIGNDVILFIKDKKSRKNLSTADVRINDIPVAFDESYGGYAFDKRSVSSDLLAKSKAFLHVSVGDEYNVMRYNFVNGYRGQPSGRRLRAANQTLASTGYLINDKPVYRPGDTLRVKAFLTHPLTGLPFKNRATFTIYEPMQNFVYTKKLKPVSPGAFVFDWKLPDTLKIDRSFQMAFNYKVRSNTFVKSSSFYLENYALSTNTYDAFMLKEEFYPYEDLHFRVRASDANRFPLQGTMIHYKLSLNWVQDFYGDTLTLSEAKRLNFFEKDTVYPYENAMDLKIPSSILPNMDANYNLEVTLTDPNTFEQKVFQLNCSRQMKKERLLAYQQGDSMVVRYLFNGRDTAARYQLISYSNSDTLFRKTIITPYSFQLSPYATQVVITDTNNVPTSVNVAFNGLDISKVKGERSADSIRIAFSFPFDEAIHYRILKNDKVVQQGKTKKLDFRIADNTKDPYTLLFTSNINNAIETNFYRITYVPPVHRIRLQTNLPEQAFPGQKLLINVRATDCYNKPLEKINIAAYAVNKQFEERFVTPEITVPESFKDRVQVRQETSIDQIVLNENNFQRVYYLNAGNFARFDLYNNEYYQLRYPRGTALLSKPIQSPVPEFAVCITNNHVAYTPKYILLDGQPIYISDLGAFLYSFQANAGTHQITFRFFDKKITLNNIAFEPGKKYWLGFNVDSLKRPNPNVVIVDSLPIAQPDEKEKAILYNALLLTNQFPYDSVLLRSGDAVVFTSNGKVRRQPRSLNVDGDSFYAFGPLNDLSDATMTVNKKTFHLRVSADYAHYFDPATQQFASKHRGPVRGAIFGFAESQLGDYQLAELQVPDTVKPAPEKAQLTYNPAANHALNNRQEPEYTQAYNSGGAAQFSISFKNNDKLSHVKALWIISKKKPEESEFRQIVNRNNLYTISKNGSEGVYDLYFLMNNEQMVVLRDRNIKNGDALYVNPFVLKREALSNERLSTPLKIYADLTRLPLLPFYFPPEESNEAIKETRDARRQKTYLHGSITNEALQPLPNVMVLAEVNGKFMYGAITNNVGEYEILDLMPGSYQLKFYNAGYQIKTFAARFLKAGYSYELSGSLKDINLQRPVLETIRQDFRFMVFNGNKRKDLMKLNLYDKDTREALRGFTLTLSGENGEAAEKVMLAKEDLELAFPSQAKVYRLEIACRGYVPVVFHNVRFCKSSFYALYLFMVAEKENPWIKKKEYDLQMQYYPADGEIGIVNEKHYINREDYNSYSSVNGASPSYYSSNASLQEVEVRKSGRRHRTSVPGAHGAVNEAPQTGDREDVYTEARIVPPPSTENKYADDDMIGQVVNAGLSQTRKNFSDVGYWQPNHLTDKKGLVSFEIRLPDNVTTWKSNVLAMGNYHLHGFDSSETRAYKPLQVTTVVPPFLWMGDKVWAKAKFTNLTKETRHITASILVNNTAVRKEEVGVKNDRVDSVLLHAQVSGPLAYKASLQFEEKYKDEEQRDITVYNPAFRFYANQNFSMEKDSTYHLAFKAGTKGEIILNNTLYEKIIEEINELQAYEYACVEQISSQLKTLLCKETINRAIQSKESLNLPIYRLVNQLAAYQNKNGSWGWWKRQPANWRMTIYATEALGMANSKGYYNNSFMKGINAIKESFAGLSITDQLYGYSVMQRFGHNDVNLKRIVDQLKVEELRPVDKMYYYKIKEAAGEAVNTNDLYTVYLELNSQVYRPYYGDFFYEPRSSLFAAYNLFSGSPAGKEWLQLFKSRLTNGQLEHHLNTYSKAALIEALTASVENTDNKPVTAQVVINDTLKVKTFPYRLPIARTSYNLKHSDAAVFVNTAEETYTDKPGTSDSLFKVSTQFVQKGQIGSALQAGVPCQMEITVDAYRSFDYVMIEIPVPSGMRFVSKTQQAGCSIEYFKNKVVVFYQKLKMQQHRLSFEMMPAFRGSFVWPAAKCSLMYYPYLFGNNQVQTLEIR